MGEAEIVLVTGATGNVGHVVVEQLLDAGVPVRAAGRTAESVTAVFGDRVEAVGVDFEDSQTWEAAFTGVQRMFLMRRPTSGNRRSR
ncbi:SDR family oxidoreductase [Micropruina sp.]|uniref:SDR family oxidoreductase n=1 Tax=Micropruina sp. TaxID=2737536 RepID=UPI0039E41572